MVPAAMQEYAGTAVCDADRMIGVAAAFFAPSPLVLGDVVCAWCGSFLRYQMMDLSGVPSYGRTVSATSHGICPCCLATALAGVPLGCLH